MRSISFYFSALFVLALCVMHEIAAEMSVSSKSDIRTPAALFKRGGHSHGHHGKHGHGKGGKGGKSGGNKAGDEAKPKGDNDVFASVSKTVEGLSKAFDPLSKLKLPSTGK